MSTKSVADVLRTIDIYLRAVRSPLAGGTAILADWLQSRSEANVEPLLKKLSALTVASPSDANGMLVREILPVLDGGFLAKIRKKENDADSKDLKRIVDFLHRFSDLPINAIIAASQRRLSEQVPAIRPKRPTASIGLRQHLVDNYSSRLDASLGHEREFHNLFNELDADRQVRQAEAAAIVKRLLSNPPRKKMSRKEALEEIKALHKAGMSFDRHLRATAGRTAG